ncbi:Hypothetical protein A7982_08960 [Minicystis rosea]|nr:Hypothetical protein A7982_08960 [Minicystis rosea]
MRTRAPAILGIVFVTFAMIGPGCGNTVIVAGEPSGGGGQGAGGFGGTGGTPSTGSGVFDNCEADCSSNGVDTCSCAFQCNGFPGNAKASCAPNVDLQGNHKIKCVCTVNEGFTGICFETKPAHLCDFELGCCGKYAGK